MCEERELYIMRSDYGTFRYGAAPEDIDENQLETAQQIIESKDAAGNKCKYLGQVIKGT